MANPQDTAILVVEDETFLRELYEELLVGEGYKVTTAVDGDDAIQKASETKFDITLLDIMLPKKDGLTVLEELNSNKTLDQLGKVVFLTNLGQDAVIKKGFDLGAVGYLIKSAYTPDQILNEVSAYLDGDK
ncbi:response regulator [bacterium]|uniref:Response regulator n=2 Tax=Katanobacteria TaxID=422282 RepID=A0A2M7X1I3_UNCKA|nr:response regulator [bacterium]PIP56950.1 MAG: response regulator [candidate division WWE3 bacterium CG22_combo_CG10-13_8_21_14_all_39_12]PJA40033.1 MAG: response regulator [candidate division WWE3 bacterium CG_4_9_14_3_um_filter_39_7]